MKFLQLIFLFLLIQKFFFSSFLYCYSQSKDFLENVFSEKKTDNFLSLVKHKKKVISVHTAQKMLLNIFAHLPFQYDQCLLDFLTWSIRYGERRFLKKMLLRNIQDISEQDELLCCSIDCIKQDLKKIECNTDFSHKLHIIHGIFNAQTGEMLVGNSSHVKVVSESKTLRAHIRYRVPFFQPATIVAIGSNHLGSITIDQNETDNVTLMYHQTEKKNATIYFIAMGYG